MHLCSGSAIRYADRAGVVMTSGVGWWGYLRFCGVGGDSGWIGLSIMADIDHNCMKRRDSREMCMVSLSICPGELVEAYSGMNGAQSLCVGLGYIVAGYTDGTSER